MKILIVTTNYFPNEGTCSNIINNILFEGDLINRIEAIDILCSKKRIDEDNFTIYNGVKVYRVFSWTLLNRKDFLKEKNKNIFRVIEGCFWRLWHYMTKRIIKSLILDYPTKMAFYRQLKKMKENKYDLIISISGRYDATKAVYDIVKNNNQKFVLYQVDPLSYNESYNEKSKKWRERFELNLYKRADSIITTPIIFNEHKNDKCSKFLKKITTMEFPVVIPKGSSSTEKKNKIVCMFLGTLYGNARNPKYTLQLFKKIVNKKIQLHLIGVEKNEIPLEFQTEHIICYGRKDLNTCKDLIKNADFLINIGNTISNQVPSKIFEYISTGKPIINICEFKNCPTIEYINKYPNAINIIKGEECDDKQIYKIKEFIKKKHEVLSKEEIKKMFYENTPEYCANIILKIIYRLKK